MSDLDRLVESFSNGSLLRPSQDALSIVDLACAVALLAGVDDVERTPHTDVVADMIGSAEHLVFVVADGLGKGLVEGLPSDSFIARHVRADLTTVFPSSTATALTTLATGKWPSQHAVTGWWTHVTQIAAAAVILQFVRRSDGRALSELGISPDTAFPAPPLAARVPRSTLFLLPEFVAGSVYSAYISGGKERNSFKSLRDGVDKAVAQVRGADGPTYTYLYTHGIDSAAHAYGTGHDEVKAAVRNLDREVGRLKSELGDDVRIVLCGDHGFLDAPRGPRFQIRASDPLARMLRYPPSGDARVLYLHSDRGKLEATRELVANRFGERFLAITVEEAEGLELFGPGAIQQPARERLGDLIVISAGDDVVDYRDSGSAERVASRVSHHSGLSPDEMLVPLVVA